MAALYTAAVAPTRPLAVERSCDAGRGVFVECEEQTFAPRASSLRGPAAPGQGRREDGNARATRLEEAVDATHRELEAGLDGAGNRLLLVAGALHLGALAGASETLSTLACGSGAAGLSGSAGATFNLQFKAKPGSEDRRRAAAGGAGRGGCGRGRGGRSPDIVPVETGGELLETECQRGERSSS